MMNKNYLIWAISAGIATLVVFIDVGQDFIEITMHSNHSPNISRLVLWASIWWYSWAIFAVAIFQLSSRFMISREHWKTPLLVHIMGCAVVYAAHVSVQVLAMVLPVYAELHPTWMHAISHHAGSSIFLNVVIYWSVVGASHAALYYTQFKKREVQTAQLEADLHKAQLHTLKMQLQPHFLFNTLNAISTLVHKDPSKADKMIAQLGALLRRTIDQTNVNQVSLAEEIDFIQKYLDIEKTRLEDRLIIHYDISPETVQAAVPSLILQPLVENAIKHGISRISTTGNITIQSKRIENELILNVIDNGPGLISNEMLDMGTGITNTRERLNTLYQDRYSLTFDEKKDSGFMATLCIPFNAYHEPQMATSLYDPSIL